MAHRHVRTRTRDAASHPEQRLRVRGLVVASEVLAHSLRGERWWAAGRAEGGTAAHLPVHLLCGGANEQVVRLLRGVTPLVTQKKCTRTAGERATAHLGGLSGGGRGYGEARLGARSRRGSAPARTSPPARAPSAPPLRLLLSVSPPGCGAWRAIPPHGATTCSGADRGSPRCTAAASRAAFAPPFTPPPRPRPRCAPPPAGTPCTGRQSTSFPARPGRRTRPPAISCRCPRRRPRRRPRAPAPS